MHAYYLVCAETEERNGLRNCELISSECHLRLSYIQSLNFRSTSFHLDALLLAPKYFLVNLNRMPPLNWFVQTMRSLWSDDSFWLNLLIGTNSMEPFGCTEEDTWSFMPRKQCLCFVRDGDAFFMQPKRIIFNVYDYYFSIPLRFSVVHFDGVMLKSNRRAQLKGFVK